MNLSFLHELTKGNGPETKDYNYLQKLFQAVIENYSLEERETKINEIRKVLLPTLNTSTMHGFAYQKPHGYAGDFEIIQRIIDNWISPEPKLRNWDIFFHHLSAPQAVRNRPAYFSASLKQVLSRQNKKNGKILLLGSGPCTEIEHFTNNFPELQCEFTCVEVDKAAIEFAKSKKIANITFINSAPIFLPKEIGTFDMIWSAGLFDYFEQRLFVRVLKKIKNILNSKGELVIGNFKLDPVTEGYMITAGDWHIIHRTEQDMLDIAAKADFLSHKVAIKTESTKLNFFLHYEAE